MKLSSASSSISDPSNLPHLMTITEVAAFYRISVSTIRRELQNGTMSPQPWRRYPYRWRRDDVLADLKRQRPEEPHRPHGFASKPRTVKASLTPKKKKVS